MVVSGETIEDVEILIKADVYYTNNVVRHSFDRPPSKFTDEQRRLNPTQWDREKLVIMPFSADRGFGPGIPQPAATQSSNVSKARL